MFCKSSILMTAYTDNILRIDNMKNTIRTINAIILTPVMIFTGFRFSRAYRRGDTRFHSFIYALVDTVGANIKAGV